MYKVEILSLEGERPFFPYDYKVDRTTILGNPYVMENKKTNDESIDVKELEERERNRVCDEYEKLFHAIVTPSVPIPFNVIHIYTSTLVKEINNLLDEMTSTLSKYKHIRLFYHCAPKRCHASSIKEYLLNKVQKK